MGSIRLDTLKDTAAPLQREETYVDLHLDMEELRNVPRASSLTYGKDIRVDYDEGAIRNSIVNILGTRPGERFLLPEFGSRIDQFLFRPVSKDVATAIGNEILYSIEKWEPRVIIENITVTGYDQPDMQEYRVEIKVIIKKLKIRANIEGILTQEGFIEAGATIR